MQGDKVPQEQQAQSEPTSSPRGLPVEQHITATSIHTITTTIVLTPQTVDVPGSKVDFQWLSSLFVPCHGAVPSILGVRLCEQRATHSATAHSRPRKQEVETRLTALLPAPGPAIGIEHDEVVIWASTSSSKCGLRHGSSNYV